MQAKPSPKHLAGVAGMRPSAAMLLAHPAHAIALGFGSGLSPIAPGTVGTLWAWLSFVLLQPWLSNSGWAMLLAASLLLGWWACTVTARNMQVKDPGNIVWDEIVAFWLVLWLIMPTSLLGQLLAFGLFRFFDAVKPGPVGWADRLFHNTATDTDPWVWCKAGFAIMFDDLVAAFCTLLLIAAWSWW